jgi:hypothetical protein
MGPTNTSTTEGYPPECAAIKALFHQQAFRRCIQACRGLLKLHGEELDQRPLHKSFVLFYLALSHDEMARVMHHASASKIPAFDSAEQFYLDALAALPTQEECRTFLQTRIPDTLEVDEYSSSEFDAGFDSADEDSLDDREERFTAPHLALISPPQVRRDDWAVRTPAGSPHTSIADLDDLESHDSFSQLMTPNRVLKRMSIKAPSPETVPAWKNPYTIPREYSRMSLVDKPSPPHAHGLPREYSRMSLIDFNRYARPTSQSLMHPIRLGSPAKPYKQPDQPFEGRPTRLSCRIPQPTKIMRTQSEERTPRAISPDPVSPVTASPVRSSPVSVISVEYFEHQVRADTPILSEPDKTFPEQSLLRLTDHVAAMRIQLKTHVVLVHHAKRQLERTLANRDVARGMPSKAAEVATTPPHKNNDGLFKTPSPPGRLQKTRSFWSFVPEDAKKAELQRRIQAGRDRKWARKRFSPERYQNLCEVAMDEL